MDINLIKNRLTAIQSKGKQSEKKEKVEYSTFFWKPEVGKHVIRIIPSKFDSASPFKEIYMHYGFKKYPILSLINWGEKDPIVEFSQELKKTKERDNWTLAKKIEPKMRVFIPVLVRGEEEKGVRLWEVGKNIYEDLLGIASDEDYGDYTSITDGRDFTVEAVKGEVGTNKNATLCTLRIKPKTSAISSDAKLVEKFLNEQPNVLELRKKFTYDELKTILQEWLDPTVEESNGEVKGSPLVAKTAPSDEFSALFEEEEPA